MKRAVTGWWMVVPCLAWLIFGCRAPRVPAGHAGSPAEISSVAVAGATFLAPTSRVAAPQFELADQFGTNHTFRFPRDRITVVTVCGRKGSDDVEPWTTALGRRYQDAILLQGVADVGGAPGFMRGLIRAMFRKEVKYPVLLDWTGAHCAAFQYDRPTVTLCVVDRTGFIVHRATGPATPEALAAMVAVVDRLLLEPATEGIVHGAGNQGRGP